MTSIIVLMPDTAPDLVGPGEIARMFGVSRQRIQQLAARDDWPQPYAKLGMGRVWERSSIEGYAAQHGRTIQAPPAVRRRRRAAALPKNA